MKASLMANLIVAQSHDPCHVEGVGPLITVTLKFLGLVTQLAPEGISLMSVVPVIVTASDPDAATVCVAPPISMVRFGILFDDQQIVTFSPGHI
jgi:hypothetical protein